jgi:hypothetical protein
MAALTAVDGSLFLSADNERNFVALHFNDSAEEDSSRQALTSVSQINVDDHINRIRPGHLIMQLPDAEFAACRSFLMVSVLGMLSLCVFLPKARYEQLSALQKSLQNHIKVGCSLVRKACQTTWYPLSKVAPKRGGPVVRAPQNVQELLAVSHRVYFIR